MVLCSLTVDIAVDVEGEMTRSSNKSIIIENQGVVCYLEGVKCILQDSQNSTNVGEDNLLWLGIVVPTM